MQEREWHKSSYSDGGGGNCVEVADPARGGAAVRDSQNRHMGHLSFPASEWDAFLSEVRNGRL